MSGPLPQPNDTPATLAYRHVRTLTGIVGMATGVGAAIAIQLVRNAHEAALLARGCPAVVPLPTSTLQVVYSLVIPVGLPLFLFIASFQLFSPTAFGQLVAGFRSLMPWNKGVP